MDAIKSSPPAVTALAERIAQIKAPTDLSRAAEYMRRAVPQWIAGDVFRGHLGASSHQALLAFAEQNIRAESLESDDDALAFYIAGANECIAQLRALPPGSKEYTSAMMIAREMIAVAEKHAQHMELEATEVIKEIAEAKLEKTTAARVAGANMTNARFTDAKEMAISIATERWGDWLESADGYCPRIGEVIKDIIRAIESDPGALGLKSAPNSQTIRVWLLDRCNVPPEARMPGQRKKSPRI